MKLQFINVFILVLLPFLEKNYRSLVNRYVQTKKKNSLFKILFYMLSSVTFLYLVYQDIQFGFIQQVIKQETTYTQLGFMVFLAHFIHLIASVVSSLIECMYMCFPKLLDDGKTHYRMLIHVFVIMVVFISLTTILQKWI